MRLAPPTCVAYVATERQLAVGFGMVKPKKTLELEVWVERTGQKAGFKPALRAVEQSASKNCQKLYWREYSGRD
jgi:hypothetical protein